MDESMLTCLTSSATSPDQQAKALQYFEELKSSDLGWQMCVQAVTSRAYTDDHIQFFCLQVIEHFAKFRYSTSQPQEQQILRDFLCQWTRFEADNNFHVPNLGSDSSFLKNKIAQVTALVFTQDYPTRWPNFFNDILFSCLQMGETAVDHYLRVLLAIDSEIGDKEINRTNMELQRNSIIKQAMRENVVNSLVDSWYTILTTYEKMNPVIVCRCLHVIGAYIHWIDINLVANDRFVPLFVKELSVLTLREASAECIYGIIMKGMDPLAKTKLVESFNTVLTNVGAWEAVHTNLEEDGDPEYVSKLGKILNGMGTSLIENYHRISKSESKESENSRAVIHAIESKVNLALDFLGFPYDEVSSSVFDFIRDYLHLIKTKPMLNEHEKQHLVKTLQTVTKKMRVDDDYNFENEGEEEACFMEFRKQMKVLFDNVALIDKSLVLEHVQGMVTNSLQNWKKLPFEVSSSC
ncbi:unnamed protein product [Allacma fusca]|uniref:Exportin-T n=1 Tax=Allacma fusca TaxID=39272 RepID=A0A8J2LFM2_9HEXA|nr:unnamed protein product [Allacma fusca]